ncbi:MAG: hypothetical protein OHK006_15220 [Thermodesulfovibrionales bacterium]
MFLQKHRATVRKAPGKTALMGLALFACMGIVIWLLLYPAMANGGPFLSSAHGNASYGVNRSGLLLFSLPKGLCAHCHEEHASFDGSEPSPVNGAPSRYSIFSPNFVSQNDNFCTKCHMDAGSEQLGTLVNRSYSYRAGGWINDPVNDTLEEFTASSAHDLSDIRTFITGKWNYTAASNPCAACHNTHMTQGDPANSPNGLKASAVRGWPISRPSQHSRNNAAWGLWGDDSATERMSSYAPPPQYQAPYRFGTVTFEPDGSAGTQDGSNMTDFVTFCTDCHTPTDVISSTPLGRNLRVINWQQEKHGRGNSDVQVSLDAPYSALLNNKVTSCSDCHEPHGSQNKVLIRQEINGGTLNNSNNAMILNNPVDPLTCPTLPGPPAYTGAALTNGEMAYVCNRCHQADNEVSGACTTTNKFYMIHHDNTVITDAPYANPGAGTCANCHAAGAGTGCNSTWTPMNCSCCHYHGSSAGVRTF